MSTMNNNIQKQLDHLNAICLAMSTTHSQAVRQEPETKPNPPDVDKSLNVVISSVDEHKDSSVWRKIVVKVLHQITGCDVDLTDAIRLGGRYKEGKKRPVLVKLKTARDRRIIVSNARKFAESAEFRRSVYVSLDESLDVRRRNTLKRLKERHERERRSRLQLKCVLSVDNVLAFSISFYWFNDGYS